METYIFWFHRSDSRIVYGKHQRLVAGRQFRRVWADHAVDKLGNLWHVNNVDYDVDIVEVRLEEELDLRGQGTQRLDGGCAGAYQVVSEEKGMPLRRRPFKFLAFGASPVLFLRIIRYKTTLGQALRLCPQIIELARC